MSLLGCACTTSKSFLLSWCHLQAHPHQCPRGDGSCQQRGPGEMRDDGKAEGTRGAQRSALQTALRVRTGENHRAWAEAWSCYKTTAQAALEWKQKIHIKSIRNEFGQQEWKKEFLGLCLGWLMLPGLHSAKARSEVAQSVHMNHSLLCACVSHADQHHLNIWPRACVFWGQVIRFQSTQWKWIFKGVALVPCNVKWCRLLFFSLLLLTKQFLPLGTCFN